MMKIFQEDIYREYNKEEEVFCAESMRKATDKFLNERFKLLCEEATNKIKDAAGIGNYYCYIIVLEASVKQWLEDRGFKCKKIRDEDDVYWEISWQREEN